MSWDRKLRKLIAEQTKPRITFKEFCEKHGIELPANYVAQTNTNEKVNVFALRVTSLCVLGIAAIIAIMFLFIPKNNFKYYYKFESLKYKFGDTCSYDITDNDAEAYITVKSNGYEYFITVTEFGGITPITKENIELLVQEIL